MGSLGDLVWLVGCDVIGVFCVADYPPKGDLLGLLLAPRSVHYARVT